MSVQLLVLSKKGCSPCDVLKQALTDSDDPDYDAAALVGVTLHMPRPDTFGDAGWSLFITALNNITKAHTEEHAMACLMPPGKSFPIVHIFSGKTDPCLPDVTLCGAEATPQAVFKAVQSLK